MSRLSKSELALKTEDGITIAADHYKSGSYRVLIICPGFMMHKASKPFLMLSKRLSKDFDIITMDFRGHGKSKGTYTFTSREGRDLKAVIDYAKPNYKWIGIIGFSLGAAVAINEIAKHKYADRLMVVSAPTEFERIENRFLNKDVIISTAKKIDWRMGNVRMGNPLLRKTRPIDTVDKISPIPILFVHGKKDAIVNENHSRSLYEKAKEPKRLVIYKECLHAEDIFFGANFDNFVALCVEWFKGSP